MWVWVDLGGFASLHWVVIILMGSIINWMLVFLDWMQWKDLMYYYVIIINHSCIHVLLYLLVFQKRWKSINSQFRFLYLVLSHFSFSSSISIYFYNLILIFISISTIFLMSTIESSFHSFNKSSISPIQYNIPYLY